MAKCYYLYGYNLEPDFIRFPSNRWEMTYYSKKDAEHRAKEVGKKENEDMVIYKLVPIKVLRKARKG